MLYQCYAQNTKGGNLLMTQQQQNWVMIQKMVLETQTEVRYARPAESDKKWTQFHVKVFDMVASKWFDNSITAVILANLLLMAMAHADMSEAWVVRLLLLPSYLMFVQHLAEVRHLLLNINETIATVKIALNALPASQALIGFPTHPYVCLLVIDLPLLIVR